jgi:hypothetical protein
MLHFFLAILVVVIFAILINTYSYYEEEKDDIKKMVEHDYNQLIRYCKRDENVLNWVTTLNHRIEAFMKSVEYPVRKPYDKFKLNIPTKKHYSGLIAFIVIDKYLNPKFVVDFEPSIHDGGRSEKYLKYSLGYGKEIDDFIKKCESAVMNENLEKKRINTVENIINK